MYIYEHICHSSNSRAVSFNQLLCEDVDQPDSCCSDENDHKDCCDVDVSFKKYTPHGKTEQQGLSKIFQTEALLPFQFNRQDWINNTYTENVKVLANPPNPQITQPKTVSERLSYIQSYLC